MLLENFSKTTTTEKLEWYKKELEANTFRGRSLQRENQIYETICESLALISAQQTQIRDLSKRIHDYSCGREGRF